MPASRSPSSPRTRRRRRRPACGRSRSTSRRCPTCRPAGGRQRAALHDRADRRRARRRRGGARGRGGDRRARARDAGPAADGARAARRGRLLGRRPDRRPGSRRRGCSRRARSSQAPSGAQGRRPRAHRVRRRRLRRQAGRRLRGARRGELARITGRPVRLVNDRHAEQLDGGRRGATRQTIRLGATQGRHAHRDRGRRGRRDGSGRLDVPGAQPGPHALPLRRRARAHVPREDEPARPERVPGARA